MGKGNYDLAARKNLGLFLVVSFASLAAILILSVESIRSPMIVSADVTTWSDSDNTRTVWTHLTTTEGDLEQPSGSTEQTAALVFDIDRDGTNDFVIAARDLPGPSLVWYQRTSEGWLRREIESDHFADRSRRCVPRHRWRWRHRYCNGWRPLDQRSVVVGKSLIPDFDSTGDRTRRPIKNTGFGKASRPVIRRL